MKVVATTEADVGTTLIFDRATTLCQRQQRRYHKVVTTSLCQLGSMRMRLNLSRS